MKILKRGKIVKKGKKFECDKCHCEFIAESGEWKSVGSQRDWSYESKCPCCNRPVYTYSTDLIILEENEL